MGIAVSLYAAGLIATNLDLARYGVIGRDFARPEYITTGVLWLFLALPWPLLLLRWWGPFGGQYRPTVASVSLGVFWGIVLPAAFLCAMTVQRADMLSATKIAGFILFALFNVLTLKCVAFMLRSPLARATLGGTFMSQTYVFLVLISVGLPSVMSFTAFVYPSVPSFIGGGKKRVVEVILAENGSRRWSESALRISSILNEGGRIGPVELVQETSEALVVAYVEEDHIGPIPIKKVATTVMIPRNVVAFVLYKNDKDRSSKHDGAGRAERGQLSGTLDGVKNARSGD